MNSIVTPVVVPFISDEFSLQLTSSFLRFSWVCSWIIVFQVFQPTFFIRFSWIFSGTALANANISHANLFMNFSADFEEFPVEFHWKYSKFSEIFADYSHELFAASPWKCQIILNDLGFLKINCLWKWNFAKFRAELDWLMTSCDYFLRWRQRRLIRIH